LELCKSMHCLQNFISFLSLDRYRIATVVVLQGLTRR
jgi:hypothetical protein